MKCTECDCHKVYPICIGRKDRHWCSHSEVVLYQTEDKWISAKEAKNRPKWCPLIKIEEEKIKEIAERIIRKAGNDTVLKYK